MSEDNIETLKKKFFAQGEHYFRQMSLENQANVTIGLAKKIESLEATIQKASDSSARLATTLNRLTFVLVVVAVFQVAVAVLSFACTYMQLRPR